ncbi:1843_t:CDS:2 [Ambispora leptoticha]|uniref:1843_t:CDS:1 n=1 Tax=Ambispora leptoticha TaxID=144679 RepID=A0A9N9FBW7_9GLOM|nr:1843_t:CDS:2 [Ambispora leptoticha]
MTKEKITSSNGYEKIADSDSGDGSLYLPIDTRVTAFSEMLDATGDTIQAIDITITTAGCAMAGASVVAGSLGAVTNFAAFAPLITDVLKLVEGTVNLYQTAEHNKRVCGVLLDRMFAAEAAVKNLEIRKSEYHEFFKNVNNFRTFQKFKNTIEKSKRFIAEISQIKGLRKFTTGVLQANQIKRQFEELTLEFDGLMAQLHFTITIDAKSQQQKDHEVFEQDMEDLKNYLDTINGGIVTLDGKISYAIEGIQALNSLYLRQQQQTNMQQLNVLDVIGDKPLDINDFFPAREENNEGKVQKRRRKLDNNDVAFKEVALTEEPESDIQTQVTILKKLRDSPNIIQFYGLANEGTKKYLVTEWAQHGNLREFYSQHPNLFDWKRKIEFALDICRGLSYLQAVDIIHHDIRSENIFISDGYKAKIGNFRLSRGLSEATRNIGANVDNVRYMAPEKLSNRKYYYDSKCEIYSFGILLWEIAEAKRPHEDIPHDIVKIRQRVVNDKYREPFSNPNTPLEYKRIVNEAVHDDPSMRPSITDFFKTLYPIWLKTQPPPSPRPSFANIPRQQFQQREDQQDEHEPEFPEEELVIETPKISLAEAIKEHRKKNKKLAWDTFNEYKGIGDLLGKYWVGYYLYYNILDWTEAEKPKEQRLRDAANLFKQAADDGEIPEAELRYGYCLWKGDGVEKDASHALKYFIRSADHGNTIAMYNVGNSYYNGLGTKKDQKKGEEYLKLAAYHGHQEATKMCKTNGIEL